MRDPLTPKQVARAIHVSESTIKRWCDKGEIPTHYTAGGHRRIALADLLQFVREGRCQLASPEALGLPATSGHGSRVVDRARDQLADALIAGDEETCRQLAMDLYLADHRLSAICDDVFAAAFRQIGERWACGEAEVYQERRGCEITLRVLHELRSLLSRPAEHSPVAIGAAPEGDQYTLGTTMAELVLRHNGWNATSLGDNLPMATLAAAIETHQPRVFWLSCSHIADEALFLESYGPLYERYGSRVAFVVGGYALVRSVRERMKFAAYCDNMQHLEAFAHSLSAGA